MWRVLLLLSRLALRPWSERAAALYAVVAIVAAVIFGGTGMHPHDLTGLAGRHPLLGAAFWCSWIVAAAPSVRALLVVPSGFALRALPVPRWQLAAVPMAQLVLAEAPWALLWGFGEGVMAGAACAVGAAAAHALMVARVRRPVEMAVTLLLAVTFVASLPWMVRLVLAGGAAAIAGRAAFRIAPEIAAWSGNAWVRGSPPVATATALLASVARAESAVFVRGAALCLLGAACALLGQRNNHVTEPSSVAAVLLAVGAPPLGAALAAVAGAVLRAERRASWLLSACGATARSRVASTALAVGAVGLVGGTAHAAAVAAGSGLSPAQLPRLLAGGALLGALLGAAMSSLARLVEAGPGTPDRLLVVLGRQDRYQGSALALVVLASVATGVAGEAGLSLVALAALALAGAGLVRPVTAGSGVDGAR